MPARLRPLLPWVLWPASILILAALLAALLIAKDGFSDRIWPADVIVIFGGRIEADGTPSGWLKVRLDRAVELYHEGISRNFIVSGEAGKQGFDETRVMQAYLVQQGIPDTSIWLDDRGSSTWLTAQNAAEVMRQQGWQSAVLVSQFYQLPRASLAFTQAGVVSVGRAHSDGFFIEDLPSLALEVIAYPLYWLRGN
jgi:vancomycin permeability regulator SanA